MTVVVLDSLAGPSHPPPHPTGQSDYVLAPQMLLQLHIGHIAVQLNVEQHRTIHQLMTVKVEVGQGVATASKSL